MSIPILIGHFCHQTRFITVVQVRVNLAEIRIHFVHDTGTSAEKCDLAVSSQLKDQCVSVCVCVCVCVNVSVCVCVYMRVLM